MKPKWHIEPQVKSKFRIDIWRPKIKLPTAFRKAVKAVKPYNPFYPGLTLRKQGTVDAIRVGGADCLLSDGYCCWHDDLHIDEQYTLLLVLRNDTKSYVRSFMQPDVVDQPAGTAILLNIWHRHCLYHPQGMKSPMGVWLGMCKNYTTLPSRGECKEYLVSQMKWLEEQDAA